MQGKSCLTLKSYIVKMMTFAINEDYKFDENATISINPEFKRSIRKVDADIAMVNLCFRINNENNDMPFSMEIDIEGLFQLENWENPEKLPIITSNAIAILFPYLRAIVSMITANANISPYVLPVMNITALFEENQNPKNND